MAYEVTSTRRRPRTFSDLKGQEVVVTMLRNSIRQKRIAHAYLFYGPRGVGKTSAARIFSAALNAPGGPKEEEWGEYPGCREIEKGVAMDVIEIDGASHTGVSDIRAIKEQILFPPSQLRYKIYIIDEVHMLSISAFNALLKTIEEPPPYVIFIFATTEVHRIPATIRSRCQQLTFRLLSTKQITQELIHVCTEMNIQTEEQAVFIIAREADGSLRDAYMLLDQLIALEGSLLDEQKVTQRLGLIQTHILEEIVDAIVNGESAEALKDVSTLMEKGMYPVRFLRVLIEYFRTILFASLGVNGEVSQAYPISKKWIAMLSSEQLEQGLRVLLRAYRNMKHTISPSFEVELVVAELCQLRYYISFKSILKKIRELQQESHSLTENDTNQQKIKHNELYSKQRSEKRAEGSVSNKVLADEYKSLSDMLLEHVKENNSLAPFIQKIVRGEINGNRLRLICTDSFTRDTLERQKEDLQKIVQEIQEALEHSTRIEHIEFLLDDSSKTCYTDSSVEDLRNMFQGKIVES